MFFPKNIDNARQNWNNGYTESEWEEYKKIFNARGGIKIDIKYDKEEVEKQASRSFGIRIYFTREDDSVQYEETRSGIFSYGNDIYLYSGWWVYKYNPDIDQIKEDTINSLNPSSLKQSRIDIENLVEVEEIEGAIDLVQIDNYLYYIHGGNNVKKITPFLKAYNIETGKVKTIYEASGWESYTALATDGKCVYALMPTNTEQKAEVIKYNIKENRLTKDLKWAIDFEKIEENALNKIQDYVYKYNDGVAIGLVKEQCTPRAWEKIETYYKAPHFNWFVDANNIYFIVRDPENNNTRLYMSINLRSGEELDFAEVKKSGKTRETPYHVRKYVVPEASMELIDSIQSSVDILHIDNCLYYTRSVRDNKKILLYISRKIQ